MSRKYLSALLFLSLLGHGLFAQISFNFQSKYSYLKGSQAANISQDWMTKSFDATKWSTANAPFRYGDGTGGLVLTDMIYNYSTLYLRSAFTINKLSLLGDVTFNVDYDDGFILWINGKEAFRSFGPDNPTSKSVATGLHESGEVQQFILPSHDLNLVEGENLVAVQCFNTTLESSDFYFDIQFSAQAAVPEVDDSLKVLFSVPSGFYNSNFDLTLSVPNNDFDLVYTIDGSNPQTSTSVLKGGKSKTITINPTSSIGRPTTPCYIVRASLAKAGLKSSKPFTQTYIFLNEVKKQQNPGGGWPSGNVNGQWIDLEMDGTIVNNARYKNDIENALLDIPTISVVADLESLFDPSTGIYVNAERHGDDWERFCSVEQIDSKKSSNHFNINAGLRIRGGWSRHDNYPKHAFRLFFNDEYGAGKLKFPLFGDEGAKEFDKIDLRCEQNYSWSNGQDHNTFVREVFSRDTQRDMGQPYTRSRYFHLYLNGMYWGLYQTQERAEARYAAEYFGGSKEDYDAIKVNTENYVYRIEASDGNTDSWQKIWDACEVGFSSNANYFKLEGKDKNGIPIRGGEILVDIDNLIDYMLVIFYTGNFDAPTSSFGSNLGPNNFYTIDKRDDKTKGFVFFTHDAEHSMMSEAISPGIGLYENRVEPWGMNVDDFSKFHPQWLHQKLTDNAEYRQRFADRAFNQFYNNGALTQKNAVKRFMDRVGEVNMAVIAESARWGDIGGYAKTKFDDWLPEIEAIQHDFFPYRGEIVIEQLIEADLFSDLFPPEVEVGGTKIIDRVNMGMFYTINLVDESENGQIYYTLDGSDPRAIGGEINPGAINIQSGVPINLKGSTYVNCRLRRNSYWSPLRTVKFMCVDEDYWGLKVTELHYNPLDSIIGTDTISGKSFEFIEFKNITKESINLGALEFASSVDYKFKNSELLLPGKFFVIAAKPKWFFERYGLIASGGFDGSFSNTGELVAIQKKQGDVVLDFQYSNTNPWPTKADGEGYSLCSPTSYPTGDPNETGYWKSSFYINGSPFHDDYNFPVGNPSFAINSDELVVYPNPTEGVVFFKMNKGLGEIQAEIFTSNGQKIVEETISQSSVIDLNSLNINNGLLLLKLTHDGKTTVKKIIYQR